MAGMSTARAAEHRRHPPVRRDVKESRVQAQDALLFTYRRSNRVDVASGRGLLMGPQLNRLANVRPETDPLH